MAREVTDKIRLIDGDALDAGAFVFAFESNDAVHHEKWIAVRQDIHHLVDVHHGLAAGDRDGRHHAQHAAVILLEAPRHFGVRAVAGLHGNDVAHNAFSAQHKVADEIQNLVAHELVLETQWLFAHHAFIADHDGVFQAAALDEPFIKQAFDFLVEHKSPGGSNFLLVNLRRDLGAEILSQPAIRPDLRARNAELFVRDNYQNAAVFSLDGNRLAHFIDTAHRILPHDAGLLDAFHIGPRRAIADGRLVGVHLDQGIVHSHAGQSADNVLDRVHFHAAFREGRRPLHHLHLVHTGGDKRLILQINAAEFNAVPDRSRVHCQSDGFPGVKGGAGERGGLGQRVLIFHDKKVGT